MIAKITHFYTELNEVNEPVWYQQMTIIKNVIEAHTEWQPTNGLNGSYWLMITKSNEQVTAFELEHNNNSFDIFEIKEED